MVEIDKKLYQDIKEYCKVNNLVIKDFVTKLLRQAFMVEKYGDRPFSHSTVDHLKTQVTNELMNFYNEEVTKIFEGEKASSKQFGSMTLPDEPPYNNILVTPVNDEVPKIEENSKEEITIKKSRKRKLS